MNLFAFLKKYFSFNRKERNGLIVLSTLIIILIITAYFIKNKSEKFVIEAKPIVFQSEANSSNKNYQNRKNSISNSNQLFVFDPNDVSEEQAISLGISKKTAKVLVRYREKGGSFKTKEDFKKIYGISEKIYTTLEPYILIKSTFTSQVNNSTNKAQNPEQNFAAIFDLNAADSSQLISLKGIGPTISKRILRYRNSLGGFHSVEQLKEVYGINDTFLVQLQTQLKLNPELIKKINLNTVETEELRQHPYFKFIIAQSIVNYRKQHGKFSGINDLKKIGSISDELMKKISPYCTF